MRIDAGAQTESAHRIDRATDAQLGVDAAIGTSCDAMMIEHELADVRTVHGLPSSGHGRAGTRARSVSETSSHVSGRDQEDTGYSSGAYSQDFELADSHDSPISAARRCRARR